MLELGFTKLMDVPLVLSTAVWFSGQNESLASRNGVPRRYGTYWYSRYDECGGIKVMVILVAYHEEVVVYPSKSGPQRDVYFSRRHRESIEDDAAQEARVGVLRKEILDAYNSHAAS